MLIYTHIYSYIPIYTHLYSYIFIYTHIYLYILIYTHIYSYILFIYSYILIYTHITGFNVSIWTLVTDLLTTWLPDTQFSSRDAIASKNLLIRKDYHRPYLTVPLMAFNTLSYLFFFQATFTILRTWSSTPAS